MPGFDLSAFASAENPFAVIPQTRKDSTDKAMGNSRKPFASAKTAFDGAKRLGIRTRPGKRKNTARGAFDAVNLNNLKERFRIGPHSAAEQLWHLTATIHNDEATQ